MSFKHDAVRRHRIPWARNRVMNWPAYKTGLRQRPYAMAGRGSLGLLGSAKVEQSWRAARYSDLTIELVLTLRLVFHLALYLTKAFTSSVLHLLSCWRCPCQTTAHSAPAAGTP